MKKEHIKSFILILLILNSIQLTAQLWFDSNNNPAEYSFLNSIKDGTFINKILPFLGNDDVLSEEKMYLEATQPRRVIVNGGGAREVYIIDSEEYAIAMELTSSVIEQMKKNTVNIQKISYENWKNLFKNKSLYVDYGYGFDYNSLNVLYDAKSYQGSFGQFKNASGFIIVPDNITNTCTVVMLDESDNSVYEHKFTCDGSNLMEFIENTTYEKQQNDTFAFEINLDTSSDESEDVKRMVALSPLSLLSISTETENEKTIAVNNIFKNSNELERFAEKTLPVFGYNPSSLRKTVQNNGTVVYVENNATIKYHYDGTIEYNAVSKENGMKLSNGESSCDQAVNDTLKIVKKLWLESELENDILNLQLDSGLIDNKSNKYTVKFNNIYNGIVVNYNNGTNSAVYAETEDGFITKFVIHLINIQDGENTTTLMPVLSAIDDLYANYGNNKMIIDDVYKCYNLTDNEEISSGWAFKVRGTEEIIVIDNHDDM